MKSNLENDKAVFAFWLEGADSLNAVDKFSDIDFVLDVKDCEEERVFQKIESILSKIGNFDLNWEGPRPNSFLRHKVFHMVSEYGLVHISRHLPIEIVSQIEKLYQISSLNDLKQKLDTAEKLFAKALEDAKQALSS